MIRDSDIVIFSLSRWDSPFSSTCFSLAKEFAKRNRVFYIDHPFSLKDYLTMRNTPRIRKRREALLHGRNIYTKDPSLPDQLTLVTCRMTLPVNFLPQGFLYDQLTRFNDRAVFDTIRKVLQDFNVRKFIYLNVFDPYFCRDFPSDIRPEKKVYMSMDDLTQVEYTARHGIRLEEEIIRKFDLTLTTSRELQRLKSAYSDQVYYQPNAADFTVFQKALTENYPMPKELLPARGKKIIGYTGNIESRLDYELLKKIVESHPDKVLVMVGPVSTDEHTSVGLADYPNVIMTGSKKLTELPQYLQFFDCALIPFKKNTLTRSIYPLKINEYLAAGRPVVSTDFSEDIMGFHDVIYLGRDHAEFVQCIDAALRENDTKRVNDRIRVANSNTWEARVETFWQILEENQRERLHPRSRRPGPGAAGEGRGAVQAVPRTA